MRFSCRGTSKGSCTTLSGSEEKPRQRRGGLWTPIFSGRPRHIEITLPTALGRSSGPPHSWMWLIERRNYYRPAGDQPLDVDATGGAEAVDGGAASLRALSRGEH